MSRACQIAVDNGGTFTDYIGRCRDVTRCQPKILSRGSLRARMGEHARDGWMILGARWKLHDGFFRGCTAPFPNHKSAKVADYRTRDCAIKSAGVLMPAGASAVELSSGEPAPILAARVATRTPGAEALPDRVIEVAGRLDADGHLIANAPHSPVHLGALPHCEAKPGERLRVKTPGGGGFGKSCR